MGSSISSARALLAAAALALGGARAHAAPAPEHAQAKAQAQAKLVDGVELLKHGEPARALAAFEQAYALVPSPKIKYDFGLAYLGLHRDAEALAAFQQFLAEAPDAPEDKRRRAEDYCDTLRARLATAPAPLAAAPAPSASARVSPGYPAPWPVASQPASPDLQRAGRPEPAISGRTWALSAGIGGVALLGAGVTFGALARARSEHVTELSQGGCGARPCTFDPADESDGRTYETLQVVFLVGGAAAVAGALILYATDRPRREPVVAAPLLSPGLAGGQVQVAF
jgi:hypothetical protein